MQLLKRLLVPAILLSLASGCLGVPPDGSAQPGETIGQAPAAIMRGHFEDETGAPARAPASLRVTINGVVDLAVVNADGTFSIHELPTGRVVIRFDVEGVSGSITLDDVARGEFVEVVIRRTRDGGLSISVGPRAPRPAPPPYTPPVEMGRGPLEIRGNNITHRLLPGVYYGDIIILGNDVTVIGTRRRGSCDERDRTILEGDLIIRGNNARVYDVGTRGRVNVTGNNADIDSPCDDGRRDDDDNDD